MTRMLVKGQDALDAVDIPVVGQCRIWRDMPTGTNDVPTDLYILYLDSTPGQAIAEAARAKTLPSNTVAHCDNRIDAIFKNAGVNLQDYGGPTNRNFVADVKLNPATVDAIEALF